MNSGTISTNYAQTPYGTVRIQVIWSQTLNNADNTSTIHYTIKSNGTLSRSLNSYVDVSLNGISVYANDVSISNNTTIATGTRTIVHGSINVNENILDKVASLDVFIIGFAGWIDQYDEYASDDFGIDTSVELDPIPGPTWVDCGDHISVGESVQILLTKRSQSYLTSIEYKVYTDYPEDFDTTTPIATGTIVNRTAATTYSWTPPDSIALALANNSLNSAWCFLFAKTYLEDRQITPTTTHQCIIDSGIAYDPSIENLTLQNLDTTPIPNTDKQMKDLTGTNGFLQGFGKLTLSGTAIAHTGFTLGFIRYIMGSLWEIEDLISSHPTSYQFSYLLENPDSDTAEVHLSDNIGHYSTQSVSITMYPYVKPQISLDNLYMTSDDAQLNPKGVLHFDLTGRAFFDPVDSNNCKFPNVEGSPYQNYPNSIDIKYYVRKKNETVFVLKTPVTGTGTMSWTNYGFVSEDVQIEVDSPDDVYVIYAVLSDLITSVTTPTQGVSRVPIFDWNDEDFNFNVPVKYKNQLTSALHYYEIHTDVPIEVTDPENPGQTVTYTQTVNWQIMENLMTGLVEATIKLNHSITSWSQLTPNADLYYSIPTLYCPNFPFIFDMSPSIEAQLSGNGTSMTGVTNAIIYKSKANFRVYGIRSAWSSSYDSAMGTFKLIGKKAPTDSYLDLEIDTLRSAKISSTEYYVVIQKYSKELNDGTYELKYKLYYTTSKNAEFLYPKHINETVIPKLTEWPKRGVRFFEDQYESQEYLDKYGAESIVDLDLWRDAVDTSVAGEDFMALDFISPTIEDNEIIIAVVERETGITVGWGVIYIDNWDNI